MAKREFVQLAKPYDPKKHRINGWYASEKLDGMRALWDGGVSRGLLASEVPFANTEKDGRLIEAPIATGLWSRYGKVIYAPDWWLDHLPTFPLDGELWSGRGCFQSIMSTVKQHKPDHRWENIKYMAFDMPSHSSLTTPGVIFGKGIGLQTLEWFGKRGPLLPSRPFKPVDFENKVVIPHFQYKLSDKVGEADEQLEELLGTVKKVGGEGIMLRNHSRLWLPERTDQLLKVKPFLDAEGTVTGYIWGHGKLEGLMGALVLDFRGKRLELSGFTDAERSLSFEGGDRYGPMIPGSEVSEYFTNRNFPIGSTVTFKYRELTDAGLPKEARYWRKNG